MYQVSLNFLQLFWSYGLDKQVETDEHTNEWTDRRSDNHMPPFRA